MLRGQFFKLFAILNIMNIFYSCSSPSTVKVQSLPSDAEVSIVESNGTVTVLGKTPLTISESDIYKNSNRYGQIRINKDGYLENEMVIVKSIMGSDISVTSRLKKDENVQNIGEQSVTQEKVASAIARANGLIQSKQYTEAETVMLNFVEQYPSVSVGYDYLGNIYYLQKKNSKALKSYNQAAKLNPQNSERRIIIERIQNLVKSQSGEVQ